MTTHPQNLTSQIERSVTELQALRDEAVTPEWFRAWSDAMCHFSDLYTEALWHFHRDTSDEEAKTRLSLVQREGLPQIEKLEKVLTEKAMDEGGQDTQLIRMLRGQVLETSVQREENASLKARDSELVNRYSTITSKQTVKIDETVPLSRARAQLQRERDREKREHIWRKIGARTAVDVAGIDAIAHEAFALRREIAKNAGVTSFREFCWRTKHRTDYAPDDCIRLLEDITDEFQDIQRAYAATLANRLGVERLRPWDMDVTQAERPPSRHFSEEDYLATLVGAFHDLSSPFGEVISDMARRGHADLLSRPHKSTVNFAAILTTHSDPLVLCNANHDITDLRVMLHECGHAIHLGFSGRDKLFFEKVATHEICEMMAYILQMLGTEALVRTNLISPAENAYFKQFTLDYILRTLRMYNRVERFQHWLYQAETLPEVSALDDMWLSLQPDPLVDWSGLEHVQKKEWHHKHIIMFPFYSIEYVIAWIGTLLFLERYRQNPEAQLEKLAEVLKYGKTRGVTDTLSSLGIRFPFTRGDVTQAHEFLYREFADELA